MIDWKRNFDVCSIKIGENKFTNNYPVFFDGTFYDFFLKSVDRNKAYVEKDVQ